MKATTIVTRGDDRDLTDYRNSESERARIADLMRLTPVNGASALDIGARNGYLSKLLAQRFDQVTALDLTRPEFVTAQSGFPGIYADVP